MGESRLQIIQNCSGSLEICVSGCRVLWQVSSERWTYLNNSSKFKGVVILTSMNHPAKFFQSLNRHLLRDQFFILSRQARMVASRLGTVLIPILRDVAKLAKINYFLNIFLGSTIVRWLPFVLTVNKQSKSLVHLVNFYFIYLRSLMCLQITKKAICYLASFRLTDIPPFGVSLEKNAVLGCGKLETLTPRLFSSVEAALVPFL